MQVTGFGTSTRSGRGRSSCNFDRNCQLASGNDGDEHMPATSGSGKNSGSGRNASKGARQGGLHKKSTLKNSWIPSDRWSSFRTKCSDLQPGMAALQRKKSASYLVTLVCRYMNELQRKDKKVVLSAKALEAIYHTASSSVGKLISGKQYLGGYAMEQQHGKAEAEGKELPYKRRKKLQTKDTAIPSTSGSKKWASF